jgi:hypothetical protein
MPIFALSALVIVGVVALAVDYGFLVDQHRNLQAFADHAAVAGAEQLTPDGSGTTSARRGALVYLRDSLGGTSASMSLAGSAPCAGGAQAFSGNIDSCVLPSPYGNYTVTIHSPGDYTAPTYNVQSLSVNIVDSVSNSVASVLGARTTNVGAYAEARSFATGLHSQTALYTDGCISTSSITVPIVVDGDIYLDQCTVTPALAGGFCAATTANAAGNIILGPEAYLPTNNLEGQNLVNCQAQVGGVVAATGRVKQVPTSMPSPPLQPPPAAPNTCGASCGATHACVNGTLTSGGIAASNCYDPGYYTSPLHVSNNLNPGIYYVDISSGGCYTDTSTTSCGGVYFEGNTMNANISGVVDKCWAAPNVPTTNSFTSPCPDGVITDPTTPVDPQCSGALTVAATNPSVWSAAPAGGLTAGALGALQSYSIRLSALTGMGETAAPAEVTTTSNALGAITVTVTVGSVGETGGYNVYIGAAGREQYVQSVAHRLLPGAFSFNITTLPAASAKHYPLFDNSSCLAGFHNVPHSKDQATGNPPAAPNQNFGVTFVLTGKAGLCMGTETGANDHHCSPTSSARTVIIQPYCASGFTPNPESQTCVNASTNDGAYPVYGTSIGAVRTSGTLATMNLSGTVYLPRGTLQEDLGSRFTLTPGQLILHDVNVSVNTGVLTPLVYYGSMGAFLPQGVFLVQ